MLDEDFVLWDKLDIYHRPSQYSFLTTLQQDPPTGLWPSNEDPFSLFHDFLQLLQLPDGENMETGGEGDDPICKCLIALASNSDPSSWFYRYHAMQTLGYAPHFWSRGRGIGEAWSGFTDPNAFATAFAHEPEQQQQQDQDEDISDDEDSCDNEEDSDEEDSSDESFEDTREYSFPTCSRGQSKQLF